MRRLLFGIVGLCVLGTLHAADLRQTVFRSGIDLVRVYITVTDADGRLVTTLDRSDFEVLDDGRPQPAVAFANTPQPIRLVLLLDVSGSMSGNAELLKSGAEHLFTRLRPDDVALVGTFGRVITIASGFTNDVRVLRSALPESIPAGAPTPLWFAVNEGIREFEVPGDARRVILVLSDGKDSFSASPVRPQSPILSQLRLTQADVAARAQRSDVMVYGVGMRSAFSPEQRALAGAKGEMEEPDPGLAEMALQTGGGYAEVGVGQDLRAAFSRIADELHGQYLVGFEPPARDGQVHRIDVKVRRPGMTARARRSYVAPGGREERLGAPAGESPASGDASAVSSRQPVGAPRVVDIGEIIRSALPSPPATSIVSPLPSPSFPSSPRARMLETWLAAVDRHEPGVADDAVRVVRNWTSATLDQVWADLSSVVTLVRRPQTASFSTPSLPRSARAPRTQPAESSREITYLAADLIQLRRIASDVSRRGGANRTLKRGAMLHADIAMLAPVQSAPPADGRGRGPSVVSLRFADGRQSSLDNVTSHWEMGRRLLDQVRPEGAIGSAPDPGADPMVRAWYLAATSFAQRVEHFTPWHVERSLQLFPRDPETLFLAACFHEALSAAAPQAMVQSMKLPDGVSFDIRDREAELREAERLFRQALEVHPAYVEARIRLGRVLGQLGRHEQAAGELRDAAQTTEHLLLYYARLFLGAELEANGRPGEARDAYEAAAALYPRAQSPRLALSALAARAGDRQTAARLIEPALSRRSIEEGDDPWWSYHTAQARGTAALLARLHALVREGQRP